VAIRNIESSIIERGFDEGWVRPQRAAKRTGRRVAIIGSGPCGLAAAQQLCRWGHSVTVFEKAPKIGGLLRYGIPEFKMEKSVLDRRLQQLSQEGVEFRASAHVGVSFPASALRSDFDAICLASGAEYARDLEIPGRKLGGIHLAMDYLIHQNKLLEANTRELPASLNARGKDVVVIGGGDTGSDCLGTAHRQGCKSATQIEILSAPPERRSEQTLWPEWPLELRSSHAHEEGGTREWSVSATEFIGENGVVTGIRVQQAGIERILPAELVLLAIGFNGAARKGLLEQLEVEMGPRGTVITDSNFMTNRPGVFAAGDARRGASLIVWAIAEGRKMATAVHQRFNAQPT
jgi:glutamate synthase (NADPH/NADH) small chain